MIKKYLTFLILLSLLNNVYSQSIVEKLNALPKIELWSKEIPNGNGPVGDNKYSQKGSLTNVSKPRILVNKPQKPNGVAILAIAGGGYGHIEMGNESHPAAIWLCDLGITVFELEYRLPQENWNNSEVPFQDAQRALKIIRSLADEYGIDSNKIGVLGFSAGGHLAGYISSMFDKEFYKPQDDIDKQYSSKPNFTALIYPVISMLPPYNKTNSYKNILGKNPNQKMEIEYSVQCKVNQQTPITFTAQSLDDPISPIQNSIFMFESLLQNKIPHEMHVFQTGGHGWGMGKKGSEVSVWKNLFESWLKTNKFFE